MTERSPSGASQNGSIVPITAPASDISNEHKKLTIADLHGESIYAKIAKTYWLGAGTSAKVRQTVLKDELWDRLEEEDFAFNSLLVLENLQLLERYFCAFLMISSLEGFSLVIGISGLAMSKMLQTITFSF